MLSTGQRRYISIMCLYIKHGKQARKHAQRERSVDFYEFSFSHHQVTASPWIVPGRVEPFPADIVWLVGENGTGPMQKYTCNTDECTFYTFVNSLKYCVFGVVLLISNDMISSLILTAC